MEMRPRILLVDDEISVIKALLRVFKDDGYELCYTTAPDEVFDIIENERIDIIMCDQRMPGILGTDILAHAKKICPTIIRILMTGYSDIEVVISAINDGSIFYYISKPWKNQEIINIVNNAMSYKREQKERELIISTLLGDMENWSELIKQIEHGVDGINQNIVNSFLKVIKAKDMGLYNHSMGVVKYALLIAEAMNLPKQQIEDIKNAGLLHDIGKITIRDRVLYKPGRLDKDEFEEVKKHPSIGAETIKGFEFMGRISQIICQHHERIDGKGYPMGLMGGDILLEAKIISIADAFDALTSDRVYRKMLSRDEAFEVLQFDNNAYFDQDIVNILHGIIK